MHVRALGLFLAFFDYCYHPDFNRLRMHFNTFTLIVLEHTNATGSVRLLIEEPFPRRCKVAIIQYSNPHSLVASVSDVYAAAASPSAVIMNRLRSREHLSSHLEMHAHRLRGNVEVDCCSHSSSSPKRTKRGVESLFSVPY